MEIPLQIDSNGIGGDPYLLFWVTAVLDKGFNWSNLTNNFTACVISGNNTIGTGAPGEAVFGKVIWVSHELQVGTDISVFCTVQARGVARFKYATPIPVINQMVEVDGAGRVRQAAADANIAAGGHLTRGQ